MGLFIDPEGEVGKGKPMGDYSSSDILDGAHQIDKASALEGTLTP
jgi:hypothetical protein